ncbi:Ferredoxin protein [Halorhabdus tiamatea SARL4B]|uniref:Ferredoxin n=1 Tax=Halorhabdus tiamatea SARL4B TaxID=1033806 RepID=F7PM99_9EURY|nr:ferredoxin [Halorhabdus tiamatea]ERJ05496.1 Ferredoxin protein [Halorhabdus tiamatea SARL4B]CCQ32913.1 [4Fe-4S] ferredoxin [Halorhabdus tiamatea SARL4B]
MATVEVDQDLCVGDQICASMEPEIYEMRDDGLAYVVDGMEEIDDDDLIAAAKDAADACPVDAIIVEE